MYYRQAGTYKTSYSQDMRLLPMKEDRILLAAVLIIGFLIIPFTASNYWLSAILIPWLALSLVALGQNILM
ncbi:MAG: branched-chain amino acid ABC transporter permease, partial [Pseudomonadota bacterium]